MDFLSFIKGMKVEDNSPFDLTFRTSRSCGFLGVMFIMAGMAILWNILTFRVSGVFLPVFALFAASSFALITIGLVVLTYKKSVLIRKSDSCIVYNETNLFCTRKAKFHFREVIHIEVCPVAECVVTSRACMWTIKLYLSRHNGFETVRIYSGNTSQQAEEAASMLNKYLDLNAIALNRHSMNRSCFNKVGPKFI